MKDVVGFLCPFCGEAYTEEWISSHIAEEMNVNETRRRFDGEMSSEFELWLGDAFETWLPSTRQVAIRTPQGERIVNEGEWIDLNEVSRKG